MPTVRTYHYSSGKGFAEKFFGSLIFLLFIAGFFYLFFQVYKLMWYACPVLLLIAFILEPKLVWSYIKTIWKQIVVSPVSGLIQALINLVGLPFVSIGLIFKAWIYRKFGQINQQIQPEDFEEKFTSYEDVEMTKPNPQNVKKVQLADSRYDDLFE
ncbi:MAG: hypothetical protein JNL65_06120 [Saprospiraceae bacterium]|nr:hypothetical protein [Saprospiraceae bacterium]